MYAVRYIRHGSRAAGAELKEGTKEPEVMSTRGPWVAAEGSCEVEKSDGIERAREAEKCLKSASDSWKKRPRRTALLFVYIIRLYLIVTTYLRLCTWF